MRKLKLYIAMSLNGKIAQADGSVEWLENIPNPENHDYGYHQFYDNIGSTIQGFNTYQQILDWGIDFPYAGKENYVFTRKQGLKNTEHVTFINENHVEFTKNLKEKEGKDIWLIGGGQINTLLLDAGLIDELQIFVMPIVLSSGIELFENLPKETSLKLIEENSFTTGAVELKYQLRKT